MFEEGGANRFLNRDFPVTADSCDHRQIRIPGTASLVDGPLPASRVVGRSHAIEIDLHAHVFGAGNGVRIRVAGAESRAGAGRSRIRRKQTAELSFP